MKRPKRPPPPTDPEEIVARALCRGDPDAETPTGPLWTAYRKDAGRVVAALGGMILRHDWRPTPEAISALPQPLRDYIHGLETRADPQLTLQELGALRTQVAELEAMLLAERGEAAPARKPKRP